MIIKTETGWRSWLQGVINIDGHAVPTEEIRAPIAVPRNEHWMLLARAWGSYLRIATLTEATEERRRFWEKAVMKFSNGSTRRMADGTLSVRMRYSSYTI